MNKGHELELILLVLSQVSPALVQGAETASREFRSLELTVEEASKAHEGTYQCVASNVYGSGVAK